MMRAESLWQCTYSSSILPELPVVKAIILEGITLKCMKTMGVRLFFIVHQFQSVIVTKSFCLRQESCGCAESDYQNILRSAASIKLYVISV